MAKCALFFVLFLVVRGTPALLLYPRVLEPRQQVALAFLSSTQLPLVVAITALATATELPLVTTPARGPIPGS